VSAVGSCPHGAPDAFPTRRSSDLAFVNGQLAVTPATLTVTAVDKSREYGLANPAFTASYSGFRNGQDLGSSDVAGLPSLTTTASADGRACALQSLAEAGCLLPMDY